MKVNKPMPWETAIAEAYQKKSELLKSMYQPDTVEKAVKNITGIIDCRISLLSKIIRMIKNIF